MGFSFADISADTAAEAPMGNAPPSPDAYGAPAMSSSQAGTLSVGRKRGAAAEPVSALMSAKENPMTRI